MHIFHATDTHIQVYYQLTAPIFELQKYSYMFWLPSIAILTERQYSNTYTMLCGLSIVSDKIYC